MDTSDESLHTFLRGDPAHLDGRLTAIARLSEPLESGHPGAAMVHQGLLCVQGNYRDQRTLSDFFRSEFGLSMEKGIEEIIEQARENGGLEGALDPDQVRERLQRMGTSDFLPIPAKVVHLDGMEKAASLDGDVVFLGAFSDFQFAHMAINAFPILYQARYREQEKAVLGEQIESMLEKLGLGAPPTAQIEGSPEPNLETFQGNLEEHLLKDVLPGLLYAPESSWEAAAAEKRFRDFMAPHAYPEDVERMVSLVPGVRRGEPGSLHRLELLVRKAAALQREDWKALESIRGELGEA